MVQRPRLPVLPTPVMPMPGSTQLPGSSPLIPGIRPPVLPRPLGAPGKMKHILHLSLRLHILHVDFHILNCLASSVPAIFL